MFWRKKLSCYQSTCPFLSTLTVGCFVQLGWTIFNWLRIIIKTNLQCSLWWKQTLVVVATDGNSLWKLFGSVRGQSSKSSLQYAQKIKSFTHSFHFGSPFCTGFVSTFRRISEEEPTFTQCRVHIEAAIKGIGTDGQPEPSSLLGKSFPTFILNPDWFFFTTLSKFLLQKNLPLKNSWSNQ